MARLINLCDTHVHTSFSRHAFSTVEEDVHEAAEAGLELVGIADHLSSMISATLDPRDYQHLYNLSAIPRRWMGVEVLRGAEVDIVDLEGHLFGHDLAFDRLLVDDPLPVPCFLDRALRQVDYAIASVHGRAFCRDASPAAVTAMYVAALRHPKVLMLGHLGRTGLTFELGPIIECAKALGKLIEVNEHSFERGFGDVEAIRERCRAIAIACAEAGVAVAVNSDAHISFAVGKVEGALSLLEEIRFPQELIATRDAETFKARASLVMGN